MTQQVSNVMRLGIWKNFQEVEESLSFEELTMLINNMVDDMNAERRFQMALQGIDPDKQEGASDSAAAPVSVADGIVAYEIEE